MTERDKCKLVLDIITGCTNRLDHEQVVALELQQHPDTPIKDLHLGERDFVWRGEVESGPLKGSPLRVTLAEVNEKCVAILMGVLEKVGAFKKAPKKVVVK